MDIFKTEGDEFEKKYTHQKIEEIVEILISISIGPYHKDFVENKVAEIVLKNGLHW